MNIGIFSDGYRPAINGVTSSIESFRAELQKRGHNVYIFCPSVEGALIEKNVFRLPAVDGFLPKNIPIGIPFLPIVEKTIRPLNLDIIHTQTPFLVGSLGHRVAKKLKIPEITTYHTLLTEYAHYLPSSLLQPLVKYGLKQLSRTFCNHADAVIAPSHSIRRILRSYGVKSPIVIIPSGIDLKRFHRLNKIEKASLCKKYNIPTDKKLILFGGRLAKEKNLDFLLDCYEKIIQQRDDLFLIYAGGGPSEDELKDLVKAKGLKNKVLVTGYLDHVEMAQFFGIGDVFAFPSVTETQGLVICEAMAAGCPILAMNSMGPKDIIKNGINGFLVTDDKKDFIEHLVALLDDADLRQKMSQNALCDVEYFSIEKCTDRLLLTYKTAIKQKTKENQK